MVDDVGVGHAGDEIADRRISLLLGQLHEVPGRPDHVIGVLIRGERERVTGLRICPPVAPRERCVELTKPKQNVEVGLQRRRALPSNSLSLSAHKCLHRLLSLVFLLVAGRLS